MWMFACQGLLPAITDIILSANLTILSLTRHYDGSEPFVVTTPTGVRILVELADS